MSMLPTLVGVYFVFSFLLLVICVCNRVVGAMFLRWWVLMFRGPGVYVYVFLFFFACVLFICLFDAVIVGSGHVF